MSHSVPSLLRPALSLGAALLALAPSSAADGDGSASQAHLECSSVSPGASGTLTLRSPLVGSGAIVIFGGSALGLPLGGALPVLEVGPPYLVLTTGAIDATGRYQLPFSFGPGVPAGATVYGQGLVVTGGGAVHATRNLPLTPNGTPAVFTEATSNLPASVASFLGQDVDWRDLDKDGDRDGIVVGAGTDAYPIYLLNDGSGVFSDASAARFPASALVPCSVVEIGDVDGDGHDDVFLGGAFDEVSPAPNRLLLNDGTGSFVEDASFPVGTGRPLDATFADIEGDGDLDLVVVNLEEELFTQAVGACVVYRNDGGTFTEHAVFSEIPSTDPHYGGGSVSAGDVDNDGDLDLFLARSSGSSGWQNELWLGDGAGGFVEVTGASLPAVSDNSHDAFFVDVNADGLLDVFVANSIASNPDGIHLLVNLGPQSPGGPPLFLDGNPALPATLGDVTNVRFSADGGDVDRDGDVDILIGIHALPAGPFPSTDGETVLLLNQGGVQGGVQGQFQVDPTFDFGPAYIDGDPSLVDVDGDGDYDVYLGNAGDLFEILPPQDRLFLTSF